MTQKEVKEIVEKLRNNYKVFTQVTKVSVENAIRIAEKHNCNDYESILTYIRKRGMVINRTLYIYE